MRILFLFGIINLIYYRQFIITILQFDTTKVTGSSGIIYCLHMNCYEVMFQYHKISVSRSRLNRHKHKRDTELWNSDVNANAHHVQVYD